MGQNADSTTRLATAALLIVAAALSMAVTPPASAASQPRLCAVTSLPAVPMPDGKSYAVVLGADTPLTTDVQLVLYSAEATYAVNLAHVQVYRKRPAYLADPLPFEADPIYVTLPKPDVIDAIHVRVPKTPECIARTLYTSPRDGSVPDSYVDRPDRVAERATLVASFGLGAKTNPASLITSSPKLTCSQPYADARVTKPVEPGYPNEALAQHEVGSTTVLVRLADTGAVDRVSVLRSSGYSALDEATLRAALLSTYSPEIFRCKPVASSYLFRADFNSQ
jgi:TonB family protein